MDLRAVHPRASIVTGHGEESFQANSDRAVMNCARFRRRFLPSHYADQNATTDCETGLRVLAPAAFRKGGSCMLHPKESLIVTFAVNAWVLLRILATHEVISSGTGRVVELSTETRLILAQERLPILGLPDPHVDLPRGFESSRARCAQTSTRLSTMCGARPRRK